MLEIDTSDTIDTDISAIDMVIELGSKTALSAVQYNIGSACNISPSYMQRSPNDSLCTKKMHAIFHHRACREE